MLAYKSEEVKLVQPVNIEHEQGFSMQIYDPKFKEFVVIALNFTDHKFQEKIVRLIDFSIMIVVGGAIKVFKTDEKVQINADLYSTWLLGPGKYIFTADKPALIYIATEGN